MPTSSKDFKVKNGLQVANDGVFGGNLTAAAPVSDEHVATKSYVDTIASNIEFAMPVGADAPSSPSNGDLWFNTEIKRLSVFYAGQWISLSSLEDSASVPNHTHDENGNVSATFVDAGNIKEAYTLSVDAGLVSTTDWGETYNGGFVNN